MTGRGDCEDYAVAKSVALRAAGIAEDDVRLVIVRNLGVGDDHAVVAARLDGSWIIHAESRGCSCSRSGKGRLAPANSSPDHCQRMSALGQKRTSANVGMMSVLPPKADIAERDRNVHFVPKGDIRVYSTTSSAATSSVFVSGIVRPSPPWQVLERVIADSSARDQTRGLRVSAGSASVF
jgi:hypothetical protein